MHERVSGLKMGRDYTTDTSVVATAIAGLHAPLYINLEW